MTCCHHYRKPGFAVDGPPRMKRACNSRPVRFARSRIGTRTPLPRVKIETTALVAESKQHLGGGSAMGSLGIARELFLQLSALCADIWQRAAARIAERSLQLFAPVVEVSPLGDVTEAQSIGVRLARESRAVWDHHTGSACAPRSHRLLDTSDQAIMLLRLRHGGLW